MLTTQKYLTNCKSLYICIYCRAHLANHDELVSRSFQGVNGRAYLFNSVINITCGPAVQRELITGSHAVADIYCANCKTVLGWKYEKAYEENQRYKEGKFIIELAHVIRENRHLELDKGELLFSASASGTSASCSGQTNNGFRSGYKSVQTHSSDHRNRQSFTGSFSTPSSSSPSTTSPTSPSHWSALHSTSPIECWDDDDEELMFPFYDELCSSRSSYPNSLSSGHHNRMRRSLYLDSTPYDWKFSARSEPASSPKESSPSLLPSSTAASNDFSRSLDKNTGGRSRPSGSRVRQISVGSCFKSDAFPIDDDYQFEFEADRVEPSANHGDNNDYDSNPNHQYQVTESLASEQPTGSGTISATDNKPTTNTNPGAYENDDEEFFDCYSDHDILNN